MPIYFNVFECGRKLLKRLDVSYEKECMATPIYEYYKNLLEMLVSYNNINNEPLSNNKIQQAVSIVMAEMEGEERDAECNANNVTMDTISNIYISRPTLDSTTIGLKNHCTISPSHREISIVRNVHSTISP